MVGVFQTIEAEGVKSADTAAAEAADAAGYVGAVPTGMADPSCRVLLTERAHHRNGMI